MSYFLFGSFNVNQNKMFIQNIKLYGEKNGVYFWFDDEVIFYQDITKMCFEQNSLGNVKFALTSFNQKYNSSDLLFPYDKYTVNDLFKDNSREFFYNYCENNLDILFDCLHKLMEVSTLSHLEIFVVEGYDDTFQRKTCSLDKMKEDLLIQIENSFFINSCIYQINI